MRLACEFDNRGRAERTVLVASRRGLSWRHGPRADRCSLRWTEIDAWHVGPDHRLGQPSHTHALTISHAGRTDRFRVRGPRGALTLVRLRRRIDHWTTTRPEM